ncbi:Toxin HigB [Cupriavidus necator H850]|jgi:serine/threonine-protein kinase HipA|uniref:HipA domain-containing protein n=1 Tax=Cupriavidus TaxID=106589 RepID=UPI00129EA94A|nr:MULTISPECIES: HipA domain-containing protein [Cupriavidus]KAI3597036.1 Toxin HigB [Cupriavidus necator H850]QUN26847.1 HipA domain-containing protein [Cupriavidus sp. KK10]
MAERVLVASINGTPVGELHEASDAWSFRYDAAWLGNPHAFALSPALPLQPEALADGSTMRPVQWYFDNLLPEDGQRALLARDASIRNEADAFALLAHYGAESAGSLTLLPPGRGPATAPALRHLSDAALDARIHSLPSVPLTHGAVKRMSLAGAQHKLAVVLQDGALFEPGADTPSTHILKPTHQMQEIYPHSVINEWFVMSLAVRLKLEVPPVYRRYVPSPVYLIDRFDRHLTQHGQWQRLHAIDACQLLNLPRTFKYDQGSVERLAQLATLCRAPAVARARLFDWLVFNILVGNSDAHLKNLSFLVSDAGIALAPFYDLLSEAAYATRTYDKTGWPQAHRFAWPVLGVEFYSDFSRALVLEAGRALGLTGVTAERRLDAMLRGIGPAAQALYEQAEQQNAAMARERPALTGGFAGELACLRVIRFTIIADMVRALAAA